MASVISVYFIPHKGVAPRPKLIAWSEKEKDVKRFMKGTLHFDDYDAHMNYGNEVLVKKEKLNRDDETIDCLRLYSRGYVGSRYTLTALQWHIIASDFGSYLHSMSDVKKFLSVFSDSFGGEYTKWYESYCEMCKLFGADSINTLADIPPKVLDAFISAHWIVNMNYRKKYSLHEYCKLLTKFKRTYNTDKAMDREYDAMMALDYT